MIYVDSNLFIYAVGRLHPLRDEARTFFFTAGKDGKRLVTSAEALQELLHVYLPVQRFSTLDSALDLVARSVDRVLAVEAEDVLQARALLDEHGALSARDLLHLAVCYRHRITELKTYDRGLHAAFTQRKQSLR